eukprot:9084844-Pyramimonas_sp.AAC.1
MGAPLSAAGADAHFRGPGSEALGRSEKTSLTRTPICRSSLLCYPYRWLHIFFALFKESRTTTIMGAAKGPRPSLLF